jgi:predicted  nucleic acid-binding Zn-ribbon protein
MNTTLKRLIRLQQLLRRQELEGSTLGEQTQINRLRAQIEPNDLRRFDHFVEHGRLAVAALSVSGACGSCHLQLTPADALRSRRAEDRPFTCPNCGCFLYAQSQSKGGVQKRDANRHPRRECEIQ